jgi:hypothetical protein
VHARYGGRVQTGISPSSQSDVVMFFIHASGDSDADAFTGWGGDGLLHYVGEGSSGDQRMTQGNKAIVNHRGDRRSLEGFLVNRSDVTYLGEFEFVSSYLIDGPDGLNPHLLRQMIVFQLRNLSDLPVDLPQTPFSPVSTPRIDVTERDFTPHLEVRLSRHQPTREASLVGGYAQHLQRRGHQVKRLRIVPPDEAQPMITDLWDETGRELVEAKTSATRDQVRMAIATLMDYARFVPDASLALLVPNRPRPDLVRLLHHAGVAVIYQDDTEWRRESPAAAVPAGSPETCVTVLKGTRR